MGLKKIVRGKIIGHEGVFTIRIIPSFEGHDNDRKMKISTIGIFVGKNKLKEGFKNLLEASDFAKNAKYHKKRNRFV